MFKRKNDEETPVPSVEAVYKLGVDGVLALSWELDDLAPVLRLHQADHHFDQHRGVKYCPAPRLVSSAIFCSRPS